MEKQSKEVNSFVRMLAGILEMFKDDMNLEVALCNSHTSKTLKVIAIPEKNNTVEVLVPYQIYEGAKNFEICEKWSVEYWKGALRTLPLEFAVKGNPSARYMTRKGKNVDARLYADFFWKRFETMSGWNIVTPEIPVVVTPVLAEPKALKPSECVEEAEEEKVSEAKAKVDLQEIYKMMGMKFAAL